MPKNFKVLGSMKIKDPNNRREKWANVKLTNVNYFLQLMINHNDLKKKQTTMYNNPTY